MKVFKWLIKEHPTTDANRLAQRSFRVLCLCFLLWPLTWVLLIVIYAFYDDPYNLMIYIGSYFGIMVCGASLIVPCVMAVTALLKGTSRKVQAGFTAAISAFGFFGLVALILIFRGKYGLPPIL